MRRIFPAMLLFTLAALFLAACSPPSLPPASSSDQEGVGMANPAAKHCMEQGYKYEIRKDAQGNEYGVCIFDEKTECDAWAYFRGECGPDVNASDDGSTNLANPAAVYCHEQGFKYETRTDDKGNAVGVCIFDDGSECDAWAYYRGECGQDQAKNLSLNLVETAGLADTARIDVIWLMAPDADPEDRQPAFSVTDPADIQMLLVPLDDNLPLVPPMRCPPVYELQFQDKNGGTESFNLGICGLYGPQSYFKGLVVRTPESFNAAFNDLLEKAGVPH
jgi:putative hemolysin